MQLINWFVRVRNNHHLAPGSPGCSRYLSQSYLEFRADARPGWLGAVRSWRRWGDDWRLLESRSPPELRQSWECSQLESWAALSSTVTLRHSAQSAPLQSPLCNVWAKSPWRCRRAAAGGASKIDLPGWGGRLAGLTASTSGQSQDQGRQGTAQLSQSNQARDEAVIDQSSSPSNDWQFREHFSGITTQHSHPSPPPPPFKMVLIIPGESCLTAPAHSVCQLLHISCHDWSGNDVLIDGVLHTVWSGH